MLSLVEMLDINLDEKTNQKNQGRSCLPVKAKKTTIFLLIIGFAGRALGIEAVSFLLGHRFAPIKRFSG